MAKKIAEVAAQTNQLPSAFGLPMANGHTMVITAPNAYELLCRTIVTWKDTKYFPDTVPLLLGNLAPPSPDPSIEPSQEGLRLAIFSEDLSTNAHAGLSLAESRQQIISGMKFGESKSTSYYLTAAQLIVAMSVLIDDAVNDFEKTKLNKIPDVIVVPLVHSPVDWNDNRNPLDCSLPTEPPPPPVIQPSLNISIQGIDLNERAAHGGPMSFCGAIRIELLGVGPIVKVRLLLDGVEKQVFDGLGPHVYDLNTLTLADGTYTFSVTATDTDGKLYSYIYSFTVANGRKSGFTPADTAAE